jgi:hypothetical protein
METMTTPATDHVPDALLPSCELDMFAMPANLDPETIAGNRRQLTRDFPILARCGRHSDGPWGRYMERVDFRFPGPVALDVIAAPDVPDEYLVVAFDTEDFDHPDLDVPNLQLNTYALPRFPEEDWARYEVLRQLVLVGLTHEVEESLFVDGKNCSPHQLDQYNGIVGARLTEDSATVVPACTEPPTPEALLALDYRVRVKSLTVEHNRQRVLRVEQACVEAFTAVTEFVGSVEHPSPSLLRAMERFANALDGSDSTQPAGDAA